MVEDFWIPFTHRRLTRRRFVTLLTQAPLVLSVRHLQLPRSAAFGPPQPSGNGYGQGGYGQGAYPASNERHLYLPFIAQKEE